MLSEVRWQQKVRSHPLAPRSWVVRSGPRLAAARLDASRATAAEFSLGCATGVDSARGAPTSGGRSSST